jgi:hypothetical protein
MNNASFLTADRTTHLKIVVVSLMLSIAVIGVGIAARTAPEMTAARVQSDGPVKAGKPVIASSGIGTVR